MGAKAQGRPRSEKARQAILGAAIDLLEREGFGAVTVEAIAARAGVSKATVYRWWPNKAAVVTEGFLEFTAPQIGFIDTGDVREDLGQHMRKLGRMLASGSGRTIGALIAESQADPEVAEAFRSRWIAARRAEMKPALRRAVEHGELRSDLDLDTAIDALYGPIYYRLLTGYAPLSDDFVDALADYIMSGICTSNGSEDGKRE